MGIKNYINQQIVGHAAFVGGYIESIDDDGLLTIRIKGRSTKIKVYNNTSVDLSEGSSVELGRLEGDSQKYSIVGFGSYSSPDGGEVVNI